jgi:hypothetical protein
MITVLPLILFAAGPMFAAAWARNSLRPGAAHFHRRSP